jgi:hypothetical protein
MSRNRAASRAGRTDILGDTYVPGYNVGREAGPTARLARALRLHGVARGSLYSAMDAATIFSYHAIHVGRTFRVGELELAYRREPTHTERAIEVPIGLEFLRRARKAGARVLEVGNVLGRSQGFDHVVLDKYEFGLEIVNDDICTYSPVRRFDAVLAISTLEHIGIDEPDGTIEKIVVALSNISSKVLTPGGIMFATLPVGYNRTFDEIVSESGGAPGRVRVMARTGLFNLWEERTSSWVSCRLDALSPRSRYSSAGAIYLYTLGSAPFWPL